MAYTITIPVVMGTGQGGLVLRVQLKDAAGVNVGGLVTSGFVDLGDGNYGWTGSIPDGFDGFAVFTDAGSTVEAVAAINPGDQPAAVPGGVSVSASIGQAFHIEMARGEGKTFEFQLEPAVDLSGQACEFRVGSSIKEPASLVKSIAVNALGAFSVTITAAESSGTPLDARDDAWKASAWRTTVGAETQLAFGDLVIVDVVR
jgi:hypothetical protein